MGGMIKKSLSFILSLLMISMPLIFLTSCSQEEMEDTVSFSDSNYSSYGEGFTDVKVVDEASVMQAIESISTDLGISNPEEELDIVDTNRINGDTYYRLQQYYQDIPVYGKTVVLSADREGNATAVTSNYTELQDGIITTPSISVEQANDAIFQYYNETMGVEDASTFSVESLESDDLYIYPANEQEAVLAYVLPVGCYDFVINAQTGEMLQVFQRVVEDSVVECYNSDGSASFDGYYSDSAGKYLAYNQEREITVRDYNRADSTSVSYYGTRLESNDNYFGNVVNGDTSEAGYDEGVTLMNNISRIYDFYSTHYSETGYGTLVACYNDGYDSGNNALGGSTSDGDGYVSFGYNTGVEQIDVMAHEYTHVITRHKVNWANIPAWTSQADQPGAINEGYSDIFGELIEAFLAGEDPDWQCSSFRNIANPGADNLPDNLSEAVYEQFTDVNGNQKWGVPTGNGHYTDYSHGFSTIISHAAYLMWNGIDGTENQKIDVLILAELWYRALQLLQSNSTFSQCADAVILAAQQMYQYEPADGEEYFTLQQLQCVEQAFVEVGITSRSVPNGSTIYAMNASQMPYDNYHLVIQQTGLPEGTTGTTVEADITDTNGYTFDLQDGAYVATVTDNAENGSSSNYSIQFNVSSSSSGMSDRRINIYTDFMPEITVTNFTIPTEQVVTLGELSVIEPEIIPSDANGFSVRWSSSDESVATVSPTGEVGIITTLAKGTTTITAELTSGGQTITKTTNLRVASQARDTVLVLDISSSMDGEPLDEMKKAAVQFCQNLLGDEYNNRVGLVFYNTQLITEPLTDDLDAIISRIESIRSSGRTDMEAGLSAANSMLQSQGAADSIKNVVIMADGLPNEGKTSNSGSMPNSGMYNLYGARYANAVIDTAQEIMANYNLYSLGFFHSLSGTDLTYARTLMQQLTNQTDGYYQVDQAENLQFAFGDISEEINVGSKIIINIACPVDVTVSYGGEKLSSSSSEYCDAASFGTLQLLGKNRDIKVVSLDSDKEYDVKLVGTGQGQMDYSVNYFDDSEKLADYRSFEAVPITQTTVITSNTNNTTQNVSLNIDEDGDGEIDTIWTAMAKSKGEITYQKELPEPEQVATVVTTPTEEIPVWLTVAIGVFAFVLIGSIVVTIVLVNKKSYAPAMTEGTVPVRLKDSESSNDMPEHQSSVDSQNEKNEQTTEEKARTSGVIQITNGSMDGFTVPIQDGETLILGKDPKIANIVFSSDYKHVSRLHCSVTFDAKTNMYYVVDFSSNGTYFTNKKRLEKEKRTPVNLNTVLVLANDECTILLR